ncbi:hypothetical protein B0H67DRAFT_498686 [Lasiosphaeris hirsuta]|uniref:Uncharacterized protein n=1 Tax=Lasiosphaeris hirsuta TaxID=260670 RepID=A0AA39ZWS5_9PEZI|nr:hypothetical protein B0H67DRAFT_498686 [Lasiosphaeris hirsuta]
MPGHGRRVYIETVRPRSPHHTPYRRHSLSETSSFVFRDEFDDMQERENALLRQNHILQAQIQVKDRELTALDRENQELRRSLESSSDIESRQGQKMRDLRKKNVRLENENGRLESENDGLKIRIRELIRKLKDATDERVRILKEEVGSLNNQVAEWRRRYEDVDRRLKRLRENLDDHIETNRSLAAENEALRRNLELEERLRRRHGY